MGRNIRIVIDLDHAGAVPEGEVAVADGPRRRFSGWMGLVTQLERIIESPPPGVAQAQPLREWTEG